MVSHLLTRRVWCRATGGIELLNQRMYPNNHQGAAWGLLSRRWWAQKTRCSLPCLSSWWCSRGGETKWVITLSSHLPNQVLGGTDGIACGACSVTTALTTAMELGWERLIHHSDLLWRQQCGGLQWCWGVVLPCWVKGKFHTAFASKRISFPQSWIWCLPPTQHSLSTEINWSRQQGRGN